MAVVFLFYTEDENIGSTLSAAQAVPMLDQFVYMFGGQYAAIHPKDADYPPKVHTTYPSLAVAQKAYPNHNWVILDPNAKKYLDEFTHPKENVVYLVGHDAGGFQGKAPKGTKVKLRTIQDNFEGYAIPTLIATACDRWVRMESKKNS